MADRPKKHKTNRSSRTQNAEKCNNSSSEWQVFQFPATITQQVSEEEGYGGGREVSTRSSSCLRCSCSSGPLTFHAAAVLARAFFSLDLSHTHRDRYETVPQRKSKPVRLSLSLSHSLCAVENRYLFARRNAALSFCPMPQAGRGARGRAGGRRCVTMTLRFASHLNTDSLVFSCSAPFPTLLPVRH